jgi:hypothetical protein
MTSLDQVVRATRYGRLGRLVSSSPCARPALTARAARRRRHLRPQRTGGTRAPYRGEIAENLQQC